eukprot:187537_1
MKKNNKPKEKDKGNDDGSDGGGNNNKKDKPKPWRNKFEPNKYPQSKRFCILIDRRNPKNVKNKKDEIIFFEPPANCDTLPNNHVAEWYFESTRQCLIPRKAYTGDMNKENEHNKNAEITDRTITATDGICGQLMSFSFHVEEARKIKCYIIWNGQTMRFHGEYLRAVLPLLFIKSKDKDNFVHDTQ